MDVRQEMEIPCTPAQLWPWLTEPERLKQWVPGYEEEIPEDPARTSGVGVASTMKLREGSRISTYRCVVTRWEPERAVAIRLTGGAFRADMHMDVDYDIAPTASGCHLDYRVRCELKGLFLLMAPLFWIGSRSNARKALDKLAAVARAPMATA